MTVNIALPTDDRVRAHGFYCGLGFAAPGQPADDGVPEPLLIELGPSTSLVLVPRGGFGWVTAGRELAAPGAAGCLISLSLGSPEEVQELAARAVKAGGGVAAPPEQRPWGYTAVLADPDGHLLELAINRPG